MPHLTPTQEQIQAFRDDPHEGTIWMWNLLRFADDAGRASYQRYVEEVKGIVEGLGGRIVLRSRGGPTVIGPDQWDELLIFEYPTRETFVEMLRSDAYQAIVHYRQDGIVDSRLYMTAEMSIP